MFIINIDNLFYLNYMNKIDYQHKLHQYANKHHAFGKSKNNLI